MGDGREQGREVLVNLRSLGSLNRRCIPNIFPLFSIVFTSHLSRIFSESKLFLRSRGIRLGQNWLYFTITWSLLRPPCGAGIWWGVWLFRRGFRAGVAGGVPGDPPVVPLVTSLFNTALFSFFFSPFFSPFFFLYLFIIQSLPIICKLCSFELISIKHI